MHAELIDTHASENKPIPYSGGSVGCRSGMHLTRLLDHMCACMCSHTRTLTSKQPLPPNSLYEHAIHAQPDHFQPTHPNRPPYACKGYPTPIHLTSPRQSHSALVLYTITHSYDTRMPPEPDPWPPLGAASPHKGYEQLGPGAVRLEALMPGQPLVLLLHARHPHGTHKGCQPQQGPGAAQRCCTQGHEGAIDEQLPKEVDVA